MNEIVNKFRLARDKFISEMYLIQPGFTYCVCGPFTKNKERTQKFKETGDSLYIYIYIYIYTHQNELDKACFQHGMAYGDFKDSNRRKVSDKIVRDKASNIAKNPKYIRYQRCFASMVYNFFDKITSGEGIKNKNISKKELAE